MGKDRTNEHFGFPDICQRTISSLSVIRPTNSLVRDKTADSTRCAPQLRLELDPGFARRGVLILSSIEICERFSYWTVLTQLPLLLIEPLDHGGLGWSEPEALRFSGAYVGVLLFCPFLGGWLVDRIVTSRAALLLGASIMGSALFILASLRSVPSIAHSLADLFRPLTLAAHPDGDATILPADKVLIMSLFYLALALMAAGNAIYKPIISTLIGRLPHRDEARLDAAFTTFFVSIALGAVFGTVIGGFVADRFGWSSALWFAGGGMFVAVAITQWVARPYILSIPYHDNASQPQKLDFAPPPTWMFVAPLAIVLTVATIYIAADYQVIGSVEVFAQKHVNRVINHFTLPVTWIVAFNPIMILVLAPLFNQWRHTASRHALRLSTTGSFALGLLFIAFAFSLLVLAAQQATGGRLVNPLWLMAACALLAAGGVFFGAVAFRGVSKYSPPRWHAVGMGALSAAFGLGAMLSGAIGALTITIGEITVFFWIAVALIACAFILLCMRNWMAKFGASSSDAGSALGVPYNTLPGEET